MSSPAIRRMRVVDKVDLAEVESAAMIELNKCGRNATALALRIMETGQI